MPKQMQLYNRDLSWLSFNFRVLEEALDSKLPLYERIKFLAIYSSNTDEFYKVRVASYRSLMDVPVQNRKSVNYDPEEILRQINVEVTRQLELFHRIFSEQILPELGKNNIVVYGMGAGSKLASEQEEFVSRYFHDEVLPYIQPVLLAKGNVLAFLQDNAVYLAVKLYLKTKEGKANKRRGPQYAIIKLPTQHVSRFVELPRKDEKYYIMLLDDIIKTNLNVVFPGYVVNSYYSIKITRDADLLIEDEFHGDLVEKIKKSLSKRKTGRPSRFQYDSDIPREFLKKLIDVFNLATEDLVPSASYLKRSDFFQFPNPVSPRLECAALPPNRHAELDQYVSLFEAIKKKDWILHFPYHTYNYVISFFNQAAFDPKVEVIKTTQYRVAKHSAIVNALINAAQNGKDVTVFVEYKARFDEQMNLHFAEKMAQAGVKVIPSIPGLKVHAKVGLVLRQSRRATKKRGYAYLSTGNFNEKTAQLYGDEGFFTSKDDIIGELTDLFRHLEDRTVKVKFKHLLVAQFGMKEKIIKLIEQEINNVKKGGKGYMLVKMNGLEEPVVIKKMYEASRAGVKIDAIIRGVCCLIPGKPFSRNIRVIRIVDRFLEHARIWIFYNNGRNETFFSSADWMKRNLNRRIETAIPVYNEKIKKEIRDILEIQLQDNTKARLLDSELRNQKIEPQKGAALVRSQMATYEYVKNKNETS